MVLLAENKALSRISFASVAELADALDLGSSALRRAGSIPVTRTMQIYPYLLMGVWIFCL